MAQGSQALQCQSHRQVIAHCGVEDTGVGYNATELYIIVITGKSDSWMSLSPESRHKNETWKVSEKFEFTKLIAEIQ